MFGVFGAVTLTRSHTHTRIGPDGRQATFPKDGASQNSGTFQRELISSIVVYYRINVL